MEQAELVRKFFEEFTYKPTWTFETYSSGPRTMVHFAMFVEDSRKKVTPWNLIPYRLTPNPRRELIRITSSVEVPEYVDTEERLLTWTTSCIDRMEQHEMFEWIRLRGELINDPHK